MHGLPSSYKSNNLENFLTSYEYDIILLQEFSLKSIPAKMKKDIYDIFDKMGYKLYYNDNSVVAILTKLEDISLIELEESCINKNLLIVKYKHTYIINVYVPNNNLSKNCSRKDWDKYFRELLEKEFVNKKCIIGGDFNIILDKTDIREDIWENYYTDKCSLVELKEYNLTRIETFKELLDVNGLIDCAIIAKEFTTMSARLDYFIKTKDVHSTHTVKIKNLFGSDHYPISIVLENSV
jgi:exonuclease III